MGYWDNKENMKDKALKHTIQMNVNYSKEIQDSVDNSIIYYPGSVRETTTSCTPDNIIILNLDSVSAAYNFKQEKKKICILNFSSYKNPGGKFLEGSTAQEESLCYESFLFNCLEAFDKTFYAPHRRAGAANRGLYHNEAIYLPDITFIHKGDSFKADVLTCAAPNWDAASRHNMATKEENSKALASRIKFIKGIMEENKVQTAILGAYGCGVFKQDPAEVATIFNKEFEHTIIPTVVYAVPAGLNQTNYNAFKTHIKEN